MRRVRLLAFALMTALTVTALPPLTSQAEQETVLRVVDYGADPTGVSDSTEAVQEAIDAAEAVDGPSRVLFAPGTYQLFPDKAQVRELYVSNTVGADQNYRYKSIAMLIEDAEDLTIDGGGANLVMHGQQSIFAALRSSNVTLTNASFDWVSPRVVDVSVIGSGDGYRDVRIPDGYRTGCSQAAASRSRPNSVRTPASRTGPTRTCATSATRRASTSPAGAPCASEEPGRCSTAFPTSPTWVKGCSA